MTDTSSLLKIADATGAGFVSWVKNIITNACTPKVSTKNFAWNFTGSFKICGAGTFTNTGSASPTSPNAAAIKRTTVTLLGQVISVTDTVQTNITLARYVCPTKVTVTPASVYDGSLVGNMSGTMDSLPSGVFPYVTNGLGKINFNLKDASGTTLGTCSQPVVGVMSGASFQVAVTQPGIIWTNAKIGAANVIDSIEVAMTAG